MDRLIGIELLIFTIPSIVFCFGWSFLTLFENLRAWHGIYVNY